MNPRGKHLFAGPGLAQKEHCRIGLGHLAHLLLHAANRGALADARGAERAFGIGAQGVICAELLAQAFHLGERLA